MSGSRRRPLLRGISSTVVSIRSLVFVRFAEGPLWGVNIQWTGLDWTGPLARGRGNDFAHARGK